MGASIANNRNPDRSQSFTYDALNRIDTAVTPEWSQEFDIDIWGNLHTITAVNAPALSLSFTLKKNNRVDGFCYDAAGNLTHQGSCPGSTYTYDAENRLTSTAGVDYTYDGDGRRVMKDNGKLYWYGVRGEVLAESDAAGTITDEFIFFGGRRVARRHNTGNVFYYFEDHLGTSRIITDASGSPCYDADFYPFGGERVYLDTCPQPYKFTGKERDSESGLDYFGARYYASTLGRFMVPDPLLNSGKPWEPQSWNRYTYVDNNPLRYTDPFGLFKWAKECGEATDAACKAERDRFRQGLENLKKAKDTLPKGTKERKKLEKALKRIGEEGKGRVKVAFGDAGTTRGQPNRARTTFSITGSATITFNLAAIDNAARNAQLYPEEAEVFFAGIGAHEGAHLGRGIPLIGLLTVGSERDALFAQSAVHQGLSTTDRVYRLWDESWAEVDRALLETKRNEAIQKELERQRQLRNQND